MFFFLSAVVTPEDKVSLLSPSFHSSQSPFKGRSCEHRSASDLGRLYPYPPVPQPLSLLYASYGFVSFFCFVMFVQTSRVGSTHLPPPPPLFVPFFQSFPLSPPTSTPRRHCACLRRLCACSGDSSLLRFGRASTTSPLSSSLFLTSLDTTLLQPER